MSYSPPAGVANASWQAGEYGQAVGNITGSWNTARRLSPTSIAPPATPAPRLIWQQFAAPAGIQAPSFGAARALREDDYLFPQHVSNASWVGADSYAGPLGFVRGSWSQSSRPLAPLWTETEVVPAPTLKWTLFVSPAGIDSAGLGESYVLHDYQYAYPEYTIVASWVGRPAYSGAPGTALNGQWQKERESLDLAPLGIDESVVSAPVLSLMRAYIVPQGTNLALFGAATVVNAGLGVKPSGIATQLQFGPAKVALWRRYLAGQGYSNGSYGTPKIELYRNYLKPAGIVGTAWGLPYMAGGLRAVDLAGRASNNFSAGTPTITFRERIVNAVGYDARQFGMPLMGYARQLLVAGLDAARYGATDVWDNTQRGYAQGYDALLAGFPFIAPRVRTLEQRPLVSPGAIGAHELRNRTRYVSVYTEAGTWGPFFSNFYPFVLNRNRTIATFGSVAFRSGLATIENKAYPVFPRVLDATRWGAALVADRERYLRPAGLTPSVVSVWPIVFNGARVLAPAGLYAGGIGNQAHLVNTRRFVTWTGGADNQAIGSPFVAPGVRELAVFSPHRPPYVPIPTVIHKQRFLLPPSIPQWNPGVPFVEEKFTRFLPRWPHVEKLGNPTALNRNRAFGTYGYDTAELGIARLILLKAYMPIEGIDFLRMGAVRIADTKQQVRVSGFLAYRTGTGARVLLYQPDLPFARTIDVTSLDAGFKYGSPSFRGNGLYPAGFGKPAFGSPSMYSNGIAPKGIYLAEKDKYGFPSLNVDQYLKVTGVGAPDISDDRHRVDHHTIWATTDTPYQAKVNHPGDDYRPVDHNKNMFGNAKVTTIELLQAKTSGSNHARYGEPDIMLRIRYIQPAGLRAFRYGWPAIPGDIYTGPIGTVMAGYGRPTVARVAVIEFHRTIKPSGLNAFDTDRAKVELFNRVVLPSGFQASTLPNVQRVGPPLRMTAQGGLMERIGTPWASFRVRRLEPEGFTDEQIDYTVGEFAQRMRVYAYMPPRHLRPIGAAHIAFGWHGAMNRARVIRPMNCCCGLRAGRPVVTQA